MRDILINLDEYVIDDLYKDNIIRQGENLACQFVITLNDEFTGYDYRLAFQLNNNQSYYSLEVFPVNGVITYPITNVLTFESGNLKVELQAYDLSGFLEKTAVFNFKIRNSIEGEPLLIPEEYESYKDVANFIPVTVNNVEAVEQNISLTTDDIPETLTNRYVPIAPETTPEIMFLNGNGQFVEVDHSPQASDVSVVDTNNYFTGDTVEEVLDEVGLKVKGKYDDLQPSPIILSKIGANTPTLRVFKGNIYQYTFDTINDDVFGATEITHQYKEGTDLYPHIHWASNGVDTSDRYVNWELEYSIGNGVFSSAQAIQTYDVKIPANSVDRTSFLSSFAPISGAGLHIGAYIVWRFRRIASVGLAPSSEPFAIAVGFHVEQDTFGSTQLGTK